MQYTDNVIFSHRKFQDYYSVNFQGFLVKFTTGIRINALCACANTVVTKVTENGVARPKCSHLCRKMAEQNSNISSDLSPEVVLRSKLRMCGAEKIAKIDEKQRRTAKISTSYRKSMSLNPFTVTDLGPEVVSMHLLCMRKHYCHV